MTEEATAKRTDAHIAIDISVSDRSFEGGFDPANCAELLLRLQRASIEHAQGGERSEEQRRGAINALSSVIDFLAKEGVPPELTLPLRWLSDDYYVEHYVESRGNTMSSYVAGNRGLLIAAIDTLCESGVNEPEARKAVSLATGQAVSVRELRNHKGNLKRTLSGPKARKQYDDAMKALRKMRLNEFANASPEFWRESVLEKVVKNLNLKKA